MNTHWRKSFGPSEFTSILIGDEQMLHHYKPALNLVLQIGEVVRQSCPYLKLYNIGDMLDASSLSGFPSVKRPALFADEIKAASVWLDALKKRLSPDEWTFIMGNHEARLLRVLANTPQLAQFDSLLAIGKQLNFEGRGIKCPGPYGFSVWMIPGYNKTRNIQVGHGQIVRKEAGQSAIAEARNVMSGSATGHTHRGAALRIATPDTDGTKVLMPAIETACLSKLVVPGLGDGLYDSAQQGNPLSMNSHLGFSVVSFSGGFWNLENVLIEIDGEETFAWFRGVRYIADVKDKDLKGL